MSKYDFDLNLEDRNSLSVLLSRIQLNSRVLEFGPANGRMTKYMKEQLNCKIYAVEIDPIAAQDSKKYVEKVVIDSIENYTWKKEFKDMKFDYIIFADVLEHLYCPEKVLDNVKDFLSENGSILVSIPNIGHNSIIINLLNNEFNYNELGILDNTHIRFFTKNTFDALIEKLGYFISYESAIYINPENTEFNNSYIDIKDEISDLLQKNIYGEAYQLIYEIKKYKIKKESIFNARNEKVIQLFIEDENEFSEKNSIKYSINSYNGIQKFEFNLKNRNNIKSLRLDPLDDFCIISINQILINDERYYDIRTNAFYEENNIYYFDINDPQIYLDLFNYNNINTISVTLEYLSVGKKEIYNSLKNILLEKIHEKEQQIHEKEQQIHKKEQQIHEKEQQIHEKEQQIHEKQVFIKNLNYEVIRIENIAQSLRIKNRIKNRIKFFIPDKIWKILRYIKNNPASIRLGLHILKNQGIMALIRKVSKINNLSEDRIINSYVYNEPILTSEIKKELINFAKKPLISIIMPVYNVDPMWLDLAIKSVENQWYENWELCIADDKSTNKETLQYLQSIKNPKIKIKFLKKNLNISAASNEALTLASGEYIALMDNDDEITLNALFEVVKVINETNAEFIYSDEDKLEMNGSFCDPHFKPDFTPDMFLSQNYISHFTVIKKNLIDNVSGFTIGLEGSQDFDLYLKIFEHTSKIFHIQKVLYHWRKIPGSTAAEFSDKSYAQDNGKKALEYAIERRKIDAKVENGKYPGTYRVKYNILNNPLVSIVIPFKDKPELLNMCIESIINKSTYENFEIIGISNNSTEEETFSEMQKLEKLDNRIRFYEYNVPFNYSEINNYAINNYVKGEHIILLNNDIEIITHEWIESMLEHSQRDEIGCVGAKLYYPNNTIQHAGVIIGIGGVAGHSHKYFERKMSGYFSRLELIQNLSAVTAACLMIKTKIFKELNGLNEENLKVAFNDVDFCLRVQENGYRNIFTPYCEAYHHESISRGLEDNIEKINRFHSEIKYMKERHYKILEKGDPYYNSKLTLDREDFSLK